MESSDERLYAWIQWLPEMTRANDFERLLPGDLAERDNEWGKWYIHRCPVCKHVMSLNIGQGDPRHYLRNHFPLSLWPSIVCPLKKCHYYIENGKHFLA